MVRILSLITSIVLSIAVFISAAFNAQLVTDLGLSLSQPVLNSNDLGGSARYHLGVIVPDTVDSFFDGLLEGIQRTKAEYQAAVQVFRYSEVTGTDANRWFSIGIKAKLDGLIMYVPGGKSIAPLMSEASNHNMTFVPVGTDIPSGNPQGFIGTSSFVQGFEAANILGKKLGRDARIGIILPSDGSNDVREDPLYRGVVSALRNYPGSRIVQAIRPNSGLLSGEDAAYSLFDSGIFFNALICSNAQYTEGAAQVVIDANKVGQIMIVGTDETDQIRQWIQRGVITASILRDSDQIGSEAMREVFKQIQDRSISPPREVGYRISLAPELDE